MVLLLGIFNFSADECVFAFKDKVCLALCYLRYVAGPLIVWATMCFQFALFSFYSGWDLFPNLFSSFFLLLFLLLSSSSFSFFSSFFLLSSFSFSPFFSYFFSLSYTLLPHTSFSFPFFLTGSHLYIPDWPDWPWIYDPPEHCSLPSTEIIDMPHYSWLSFSFSNFFFKWGIIFSLEISFHHYLFINIDSRKNSPSHPPRV